MLWSYRRATHSAFVDAGQVPPCDGEMTVKASCFFVEIDTSDFVSGAILPAFYTAAEELVSSRKSCMNLLLLQVTNGEVPGLVYEWGIQDVCADDM